MMLVCGAEKQLTVDDIPEFPQFLVYDRETELTSPMTAENCHTESWYTESEEPGLLQKVINFFRLLIQWWKTLAAVVKEYLG